MDLSYRLKRAGVRIQYIPDYYIYHSHNYRNRKSSWINFLLARRLSDVYFAQKYFGILSLLTRLYAIRDIRKRNGKNLDRNTYRIIRALVFLQLLSYYELQKTLVNEGLDVAFRKFAKEKMIHDTIEYNPSETKKVSRQEGRSIYSNKHLQYLDYNSLKELMVIKQKIRRLLYEYRLMEQLIYSMYINTGSIPEISNKLGLSAQVIWSVLNKMDSKLHSESDLIRSLDSLCQHN